MELKISLTTCNACDSCNVTIKDQSEYLSEDSTGTVKGKFKFSDTISLDILQLNKSSEPLYLSPTYTKHEENKNVTLSISQDGWYSVVHLVLPSIDWFNTELAKSEGSAIGLYSAVYYTDGENIYKYEKEKITQEEIPTIVEINTIDTTISRTSTDFISICLLRKCYINLCQQIFNDRGMTSCWSKNTIDSELVFKRDLVWMAINVIKYLTECEQLAEVERIIENITSCNGICASSSTTTSGCGCQSSNTTNTNGCGCSN